MRLKTFSAPSLSQAMSDVRREMGPDAVIIATSELPLRDMRRGKSPASEPASLRDSSLQLLTFGPPAPAQRAGGDPFGGLARAHRAWRVVL